jgi:hypothetical protein
MPTNPLIYVAVIGWLMALGTYGFQKVQQARQWQLAYDQGLTAGKATTAAAAVESAQKTLAIEQQAIDTTPVPASKAAIVELCKRSSSCREHGKLTAGARGSR